VNAYILDNDLIDVRLCDYMRDNLDMAPLAAKLRKMIKEGRTLGEMVTTILVDTKYCNDEEISKIKQILVDNASLSFAAKRKVRGDNLLCANKYPRAIEEYQYVLSVLNKEEEPELYSSILHNVGCSYALMFLLDKAADYFKQAYEIDGSRESLVLYLVCLRLTAKKEEYDRIVVKNGYDERVALEAVRIMTSAREADIDTPYADAMKDILDLRGAGRVSEFYAALDTALEEWKTEYRRTMS
jgi:tetratricopeptide (TPR) repeat protein